jgi:hypothetical protein
MSFERIVTHGDFDGVVSAALCSCAFSCERFIFTGPNSIARAELSIDARDIVCDLPYPLECGLWFDHHPGNGDALKLRNIDPVAIPGRFDGTKPSCARVVFEYLSGGKRELASHFAETVQEADTIDSFDYRSVEEWRRETPGKLVDMSLKAYYPTPREQTKYLTHLVLLVRDTPLTGVLGDSLVSSRLERYREEERRMLDLLAKSVTFLPEDGGHELIILDFTALARQPRIMKNLSFLAHPHALGVLSLTPLFRGERKTNDISIAMSLSMNMTGREHGKDIGEMMRTLNIGDGHRGAAAGTIHCDSKEEMLRKKKRVLSEIWRLWTSA